MTRLVGVSGFQSGVVVVTPAGVGPGSGSDKLVSGCLPLGLSPTSAPAPAQPESEPAPE